MTDDDELLSSEPGENSMLREAVEALRLGDRARARDLLTRLLKTDQGNATYWVWLSAAVDSQKERLYCLQTALHADPENAAAKRGLIVLGALPPDDSVRPFPVNHPRLWEEKLEIPKEPQERKRGWANPITRLFIILGIAVVVIGIFVGGSMLLPKVVAQRTYRTPTHRPTVTITLTPSLTPVYRTATPTFLGPTPLAFFLQSTYTPTPLYVMTEHPITSRSAFEAGLRYMAAQDYETALVLFQQVLTMEPDAADVYYYIGEIRRAQDDDRAARNAYQEAINRNLGFAPAFLGRARANLGLNPEADVISDLDNAIAIDPKYTDAYIERGAYQLSSDPSAAETDLETAIELSPDSALAYLYLAQAQLALGKNKNALASALHANQIDMTLVPVYLALAQAYIATGQTELAVGVMQTYVIYRPDDTNALLKLGTAYNAAGDYQLALDPLDKAIENDQRNAEAYFQRGFAYLNLKKANLAEENFKKAVSYDPFDFDSHLGLARAYDLRGLPGDAYVQAEKNALPLAKSDGSKAQVYYWESIFLEEIGEVPGARASWYRLIGLPADVMPEEWREEAYQHLKITPTFTPSPRPTRTSTATPKP
jgi:tetratricopeptide (TPR) repeat protein